MGVDVSGPRFVLKEAISSLILARDCTANLDNNITACFSCVGQDALSKSSEMYSVIENAMSSLLSPVGQARPVEISEPAEMTNVQMKPFTYRQSNIAVSDCFDFLNTFSRIAISSRPRISCCKVKTNHITVSAVVFRRIRVRFATSKTPDLLHSVNPLMPANMMVVCSKHTPTATSLSQNSC